MKALINPLQNNLVVQIEDDDKTFEVASPLYWIDCSNNIVAYKYEYTNNAFVLAPETQATAAQNKKTAVDLLSETDWSSLSDLGDPNISNPYLTNQQAFYDFRNFVRAIAINPTDGNINWPETPTAIWSN